MGPENSSRARRDRASRDDGVRVDVPERAGSESRLGGSPAEAGRPGVHVGSSDHLPRSWHPYVVSSRGEPAAAQVNTDPHAGLHSGFGVCRARLDSECSAAEGHNAHHSRFVAGEHFVGCGVGVGRPGCAIQNVDGLLRGVVPEGDGGVGGDDGGSGELHDGANGTLGDAIELMDVRRACRGVYAVVGQELGELT
eukprot:6143408-Pleurochrysis_carterae.AAC.1